MANGVVTRDTVAAFRIDEAAILVQRYNDVLVDANYYGCKEAAIPIARTEASAGGLIHCGYYITPALGLIYDTTRQPQMPQSLELLFMNVLGRLADKLTEEYRVPIRYRPLNDMEIWDASKEIWKKVVLNGASGAGNYLFIYAVPQFRKPPTEEMLKTMASPREKFADKIVKDAAERAGELVEGGAFRKRYEIPSKEEFEREATDIWLDVLKRTFGIEVEHEEVTDWELERIEERWKKATDEDWVLSKSPDIRFAKTPEGTTLGKSFVKISGGPLIRAAVLRRGDEIEDILFSGTCHITPADALETLEERLKGTKIDDSLIRAKTEKLFKERNVNLGMGSALTVADAVIKACQESYKVCPAD